MEDVRRHSEQHKDQNEQVNIKFKKTNTCDFRKVKVGLVIFENMCSLVGVCYWYHNVYGTVSFSTRIVGIAIYELMNYTAPAYVNAFDASYSITRVSGRRLGPRN